MEPRLKVSSQELALNLPLSLPTLIPKLRSCLGGYENDHIQQSSRSPGKEKLRRRAFPPGVWSGGQDQGRVMIKCRP